VNKKQMFEKPMNADDELKVTIYPVNICTVTVTNEKQSIPRSLQQIILQVLSVILYEHIFIHSN
jgi:hypothetical protein